MIKRICVLLAMAALLLPACSEDNSDDSSECGNGTVESGEECDDGNDIDDDECSNKCKNNNGETKAECGNSIVETGEECDDGNDIDDDDCSNQCKKNLKDWATPNPGPATACGDGFLEAGEICEIGQPPAEGNTGWECIKKDGICVWQTPNAVCGNGIKEDGEDCDDGNNVPGDGCSKKCKTEADTVCRMKNGSKAKVLLVQDGDTFKLMLTNDGKCQATTKSNTIVTVRIHGLDCPECLKSQVTSTIDSTYSAQSCDAEKTSPCSNSNLYDYTTLEDCQNHNERGGYEAAEFAKQLIYSEENNAEVEIACETVSSTDATCLLDNTRSRYLAYIGVKSNQATIDLGKAIISEGLGLPFTAFTSQRTEEYCAAESDAISNKKGFWANGNSFENAAKASFGTDKLLWLLHDSHCK